MESERFSRLKQNFKKQRERFLLPLGTAAYLFLATVAPTLTPHETRAKSNVSAANSIALANVPFEGWEVTELRQIPHWNQVESHVLRRRGESQEEYEERVTAVTRLVTELNPERVTPEEIKRAMTTIDAERELYGTVPLLRDGVILYAAGAEISAEYDGPQFMAPDMMRDLRNRNPNVRVYSGIPENSRGGILPTQEALERERTAMLDAIRATPERIYPVFRMHGITEQPIESSGRRISFGQTANRPAVVLTPNDIAQAFVDRYSNEEIRLQARQTPEVVIFDNCYSGAFDTRFTEELVRELQRLRRQGVEFPPLIVIASTDGVQRSFGNRLLFRLIRSDTVSSLFDGGRLTWSGGTPERQVSQNTRVTVIGGSTAWRVQLAERESTTQFG